MFGALSLPVDELDGDQASFFVTVTCDLVFSVARGIGVYVVL